MKTRSSTITYQTENLFPFYRKISIELFFSFNLLNKSGEHREWIIFVLRVKRRSGGSQVRVRAIMWPYGIEKWK